MKSVILAFVCLSLMALTTFGQNSRATRPRVAPTPSAPAPTLRNEIPSPTGRRPPVLTGESQDRTQSNTPSAPAAVDEDGIVRLETTLVTMPVSVLDRDGRFI